MKKVLSVALASAMVLGMGANAFAISYSTGSNNEADWPTDFQFDGELFVTDKDGDIIEESTTELNDNEAVDFEPGDVIWMPLYADDQYVWHNTYEKGEDGQDAVSSIRLGKEYFDNLGTPSSDVTAPVVEDVVKDVEVTAEVRPDNTWKNNNKVNLYIGGEEFKTGYALSNVSGDDGEVSITFSITEIEEIWGVKVDTPVAVTLKVNQNTSVNNENVVLGTVKTAGSNAVVGVAPTLETVPTTVTVVDGDGNDVERTVESAKAVVNGKTIKLTKMDAASISDFCNKVNAELAKMFAKDETTDYTAAVITVNLAEKKATDDVINKPHIEVANDDKVMVDYGHYTGNIDKNWSINLIEKSTGVAELIEKAELYKATATDYASYSKYTDEIMPNAVYLKVTLKDTWKTVDSETLTYYVYVADNDSGKQTNEVWVSGKYVNNNWEYVNFDWTNDASKAQLWKVKKGENGTAVFDFADKAFFTVKMYSGESMYLDLSTAYDKAVAGEMDAEADSFYKFDNDNANFSRTGELIIVTDDSSLVPYEIDEDGNFVEVDAKYVEDYAIAHTNKKVDGFVFSTKTLGNYVLSTEELGQEEQPVDETPVVEEPTTETPATDNTTSAKPNPDTGAEDFVGLAVSLAVVSVAAAGALALKK